MLLLPEFDKIKELVYSYSGISLNCSKKDYLSRRIYSRMKVLDIKEKKDYLRYLIFDRSRNEMEEIVNLLVVPETYFFRDYTQMKLFAEEVLPAVVREKKGRKKLSLLCAGCSTGEEPYTMAMIFKEMLENWDEWDLRIDGVDINKKVLEKARQAVYSSHALRETPFAYRDRYFVSKDDLYILSDDIREMVGFMKVNLFNHSQMSSLKAYDFVFCRNVLIYFDYQSGGKALEYLYEAMNPDAFIFLGSTESAGRMTTLFKMVRFGKSFVYQK